MTLEQKTQELWWCARMIRSKGGKDETAYQALLTFEQTHHLTPRLAARVWEIKLEYEKNNPSPPSNNGSGSPRGPQVA